MSTTVTTTTVTLAPAICDEGGKGFLLPANDNEWEFSDPVRAGMYGLALAYMFLGVSIVADIFMGSIEMITSRRRQRILPTGRVITVHIWNDTVANLTLMALGSSAPEILLAVTEIITGDMYAGELGPATIVGSASFNLLIIVAFCILVIPSTETKKVKEVPVFIITVVFMMIAYLWLVFIVSVWSPEVVTIAEAVITLCLMPVLVLISYLADVGYFGEMGKTLEVRGVDVDNVCELLGDYSRATRDAIRVGLGEKPEMVARIDSPTAQDMVAFRRMVRKHIVGRKSRAARRVEATRAMTGGKRISWNSLPTESSVEQSAVHAGGLNGSSFHDVPVALPKGSGKSLVQFASECQQMSDDQHEKPIVFHRSGDCSAPVTVLFDVIGPPKTVEAGFAPRSSRRNSSISKKSSRGQRQSKAWGSVGTALSAGGSVRSSSSAATARSTLCFIGKGSCDFAAGEDVATTEIQRPEGVSAEGDFNQFSIELMSVVSEAEGAPEVEVGAIDRTLIVMCEVESVGMFCFACPRVLIQGSSDTEVVQVMVQRVDGCNGKAKCSWRTERLTAVPGFDYTEMNDELEFEHGVTEAFIEVEILPKSATAPQDEFVIILEDADGADFDAYTDGGIDSEIMTIVIAPHDLLQRAISGKMIRWFDQKFNFDELRLGNAEFKEQVISSIYVNGSYEDQQEASHFDWVFHLIALPWKVVFMFVPPTAYCGGWICFILSLVFIGVLTSFIGDLAELFGCVVGMTPLLTAITFVALGTSMPDLFASKTAALQDATADASIVNVTGSNSVNVFLGLGLPWSLGSVYWHLKTKDDLWESKYPQIAEKYAGTGHLALVVRSGDLVFSVLLFCIFAIFALVILLVRRRKIGAELGGPLFFKISASVSFLFMWIVYIWLSGWWSLRQDKADTLEKTFMFIAGGSVLILPFAAFLLVTVKLAPSVYESEREGGSKDYPPEEGAGMGPQCSPWSAGADNQATPPATAPDTDLKVKDQVTISVEDTTPFQAHKPQSPVTQVEAAITATAAPPDSPKSAAQDDSADDFSVASETGQPPQGKDASPGLTEAQTTITAPSSWCMACCFSAGGVPINPSDAATTSLKEDPDLNIGIVSVQRSVGQDGASVQQYSA